jgi:hypothetical protein
MAWTKEAKDYTSVDYLLQEIGDFLLLETGEQIIAAGNEGSGWNKDAKDLGT